MIKIRASLDGARLGRSPRGLRARSARKTATAPMLALRTQVRAPSIDEPLLRAAARPRGASVAAVAASEVTCESTQVAGCLVPVPTASLRCRHCLPAWTGSTGGQSRLLGVGRWRIGHCTALQAGDLWRSGALGPPLLGLWSTQPRWCGTALGYGGRRLRHHWGAPLPAGIATLPRRPLLLRLLLSVSHRPRTAALLGE